MSYALSRYSNNIFRLNRPIHAVFNPKLNAPRVLFSKTAGINAEYAGRDRRFPPRRARVSDTSILSSIWDPLTQSSYLHPEYGNSPTVRTDAGVHLNPVVDLKNIAVIAARSQGYHIPSLCTQSVAWSDHQAPFAYVGGSAMRRFFEQCSFRYFESFAYLLGPEKWEQFYTCKKLGVMTHFSDLKLTRKPKYPDLLVLGTRLEKVEPDKFYVRMAAWSCSLRARKVAELGGWVIWWDFEKNCQVDPKNYGKEYEKLKEEMDKRQATGMEKYNSWRDRLVASGKFAPPAKP